jgi:hypothetical protein
MVVEGSLKIRQMVAFSGRPLGNILTEGQVEKGDIPDLPFN